MPSVRTTALLLAVLALGACSPSLQERREEAQAALDAGDFPKALQLADTVLAEAATKNDAAEAWRLEQIRLDALARTGKGGDVRAALDRLAGPYDKQLTAPLYRALADKLRAASDGQGAIDVLDAGLKRFPSDPSFQAALDDLKKSADPAEIERLKALGYL